MIAISKKEFVEVHRKQNGEKFSIMTYDLMFEFGLSDAEIMHYQHGSGSQKVIDLINTFGINSLISETKKYNKSSRTQFIVLTLFNISFLVINLILLCLSYTQQLPVEESSTFLFSIFV